MSDAPIPNRAGQPGSGDSSQGLAYAATAYVLWGLLPLYLKAIDHIGALEVVAHRVLWSVPVAGVVLLATRRWADLLAALRSPRTIAMGAVTAGLISANWLTYVWAVGSGRTIDAALGYYINPLFSMFLGAVLLGERLSRLQVAAVAIATLAVVILTIEAGRLPLVALALAVSFGLYGLAKKQLPVGPNQGFMLEVLVLTPAAAGYLAWLGAGGAFGGTVFDTLFLAGCGVVTAAPLMLYANGAKRLRMGTIAILQYIVPTMIFLCAVFVFGEEVGRGRAIALPMIWLALVLYTGSLYRGRR